MADSKKTVTLEGMFREKDNPLVQFLEELKEGDGTSEIVVSSRENHIPCIPYKGHFVNIPRNLSPGTEYGLGGYKPSRGSVFNNIEIVLKTINNLEEILSFVVLRQLPIVAVRTSQSLESKKDLDSKLQNQLTKITEQLETNRQNIRNEVLQIDECANKGYETLYAHQEKILHIVEENRRGKDSDSIKPTLEQILSNVEKPSEVEEKISLLEDKQIRLEQKIDRLSLGLEEVTKLLKALDQKL